MEGKADEVRQGTYATIALGGTRNDILDAVMEAANITVALNDVGEYDFDRLASVERAVDSCLQVLEDRLATAQKKFKVKATIGPVGLKAGNLLSLAVCAALRSVGFDATSLSKTQTPLDLLRNSEELGADLVIPLLAREDVEPQIRLLLEEIDKGGFKTKFEIIPLVHGLPDVARFSLFVARNPAEAISRATEWALKKQTLHSGE